MNKKTLAITLLVMGGLVGLLFVIAAIGNASYQAREAEKRHQAELQYQQEQLAIQKQQLEAQRIKDEETKAALIKALQQKPQVVQTPKPQPKINWPKPQQPTYTTCTSYEILNRIDCKTY